MQNWYYTAAVAALTAKMKIPPKTKIMVLKRQAQTTVWNKNKEKFV